MPHLFIFGVGYSAGAIAHRLLDQGWRVSGTCRSGDNARALALQGIDAHVFDPAEGIVPGAGMLDAASHLLTSIAPGPSGDPVLAAYGGAIAAHEWAWTGYLSTTGVYGNSDGGWVDESSPTAPRLERARRRVAAEAAWRNLYDAHRTPVHIFRLAGIYGPGRSALDAVRGGTARRIHRPGQLFGRIHVADIAKALEASITAPAPGEVYNVCDDEPAAPAEVTEFACGLLGVQPPPLTPFEDAARSMSAMGRSFWEDNRKVANRKLHEKLGVTLDYPDYRAGLRAILAAETG